MSMPDRPEFYYPILQFLESNQGSTGEGLFGYLANHLGLSRDELDKSLGIVDVSDLSGEKTFANTVGEGFRNSLGYAIANLEEFNLVEEDDQSGIYKITESGSRLLRTKDPDGVKNFVMQRLVRAKG